MRFVRSGLSAIALLLPAAAAQAQVLAPAGEWNMREDEERCRAYRNFGTGEDSVSLQIQSFGKHSPFEMIIRADALSRDTNAAHITRVHFGPDGEELQLVGVVGQLGELPTLRFLANTASRPVRVFAHGRSDRTLRLWTNIDTLAETITIDTDRMEPVTLRQGPMAGVLEWLDGCEDRLSAGWGYDRSKIGSTPELVNPREVDAVMYYPDNMIINRISQIVQFRVAVDEEGEPGECVVQSPNWGSSFEESTCRAIDNVARFEPARDTQGNPVPSIYRMATFFLVFD